MTVGGCHCNVHCCQACRFTIYLNLPSSPFKHGYQFPPFSFGHAAGISHSSSQKSRQENAKTTFFHHLQTCPHQHQHPHPSSTKSFFARTPSQRCSECTAISSIARHPESNFWRTEQRSFNSQHWCRRWSAIFQAAFDSGYGHFS